jgi:hypothetical protein
MPDLSNEPLSGSRCRPDCLPPRGPQAHCTVCHLTMSGITYFDAHRIKGRCVSLSNLGLTEVNGLWTTPEAHAARAATSVRMAGRRPGEARSA